jgi:hypothetical protein
MRKIPSLFRRDGAVLTTEFHPAAEWVVNGEGIATRKWDGTAVMMRDGVLYARYDAKHGKLPPPEFIACQDADPVTGHWPGWVPATRPQDRWIRESAGEDLSRFAPWTYEATGPRIGANPERLEKHVLIKHGSFVLADAPRDYDGLRAYFRTHDVEGIVWWRDLADVDCDKVKITGAALDIDRELARSATPC